MLLFFLYRNSDFFLRSASLDLTILSLYLTTCEKQSLHTLCVWVHYHFKYQIILVHFYLISTMQNMPFSQCLKFSPRPRYLLLSQLIIMPAKSCWYAKHARRLAINNTARTLWLSLGLNPHLLQISLSPNYTTLCLCVCVCVCVCACVCLSSLKTWNNVSHTEIHSHTFHAQAEWGTKYTNIVNTTN